MAGQINAFEMAQKQFDGVAKLLNLDPQISEALRWPMREYSFRIPVRMPEQWFAIPDSTDGDLAHVPPSDDTN